MPCARCSLFVDASPSTTTVSAARQLSSIQSSPPLSSSVMASSKKSSSTQVGSPCLYRRDTETDRDARSRLCLSLISRRCTALDASYPLPDLRSRRRRPRKGQGLSGLARQGAALSPGAARPLCPDLSPSPGPHPAARRLPRSPPSHRGLERTSETSSEGDAALDGSRRTRTGPAR